MIESVLEPLFHKTSTKKHWTFAEVGTNFEIHENNISFESLNYYLSICDSDKLVFGRCASARLTLELLNINLALISRNFDVDFTFEDEPEIPFAVGNFTVTEDKPSPDRKARSVTMYDALYFVLNTNYASWYNAITDSQWETMTLGSLADSFFAHVGITVESASRALLVNADMPVSKTLATEQLLGSDILFAICQAAGCFGVMTNNNEFRFLYLKSEIEGLFPANDLYPAEDLYPIEPVTTYIPNSEYYPPLVYETFMTPSITKLRIAESTEDVGTTIGSGDAGYEIIGNFLFASKTAQQLNTYGANTLGAMTQRNYRPFSVEKVGNLCFEIGDPIRLGDENMAVESYILTRTFSGVQAFTDEISAEGTQDYTVVASSISTTVDKLQSKTLVLRKDVDEVSATMTYQLDPTQAGGPGQQSSYAYQTAQAIGAKVDETHGDQITGFSWELTSSGHTWYKDSTEVMKVDGNGLHVTGLIEGSDILVGDITEPITYISADGMSAEFANCSTSFYCFDDGVVTASIGYGTIDVSVDDDNDDATVMIGGSGCDILFQNIYHAIFECSNGTVFEYDDDDGTNYNILSIGSDIGGTVGVDKVALNGNEWLHVGYSTPVIHIGGTGNTTDLRLRADDFAHITFYGGGTSSKTLQSILNDISSASSTASSAATTADNAASGVYNLYQTLMTSIAPTLNSLVSEARDHGWNV